MESAVRKLTTQTYKAQVALRERMSESLSEKFEGESLSLEEKAKLAHHWDKVLTEKHAFQFMLDLMERQNREENASSARYFFGGSIN